ncbi:hypothetical protein JZ751_016704 [Albula glossodonta]|uniref:Uncharacterized protein n=1 Tax=Albula glossodonta TaxID=121402 RepID=A0A8T2NXD9_9TELE|nr:hypothetical protein JZ751_016704 [Albula glossodonta]
MCALSSHIPSRDLWSHYTASLRAVKTSVYDGTPLAYLYHNVYTPPGPGARRLITAFGGQAYQHCPTVLSVSPSCNCRFPRCRPRFSTGSECVNFLCRQFPRQKFSCKILTYPDSRDSSDITCAWKEDKSPPPPALSIEKLLNMRIHFQEPRTFVNPRSLSNTILKLKSLHQRLKKVIQRSEQAIGAQDQPPIPKISSSVLAVNLGRVPKSAALAGRFPQRVPRISSSDWTVPKGNPRISSSDWPVSLGGSQVQLL